MIFFFFLQHNFKKIRNNIEKSNEAGKPRCLTVAGKRILWKHLLDAYKFHQTLTSIHVHEKLTEEHFQLDPALRMRNYLAEDVLDKRMHFLIKVMDTFKHCYITDLKNTSLIYFQSLLKLPIT